MYNSGRNAEYLAEPRKTNCKNIESFINSTCRFCLGASTIAQDAYDKYVRFCKDRNSEYSCFNVFARSFKYHILHQDTMYGVGLFPVNYDAYKEGVGYVRKQGWAYSNLTVNY